MFVTTSKEICGEGVTYAGKNYLFLLHTFIDLLPHKKQS